MKKLDGKDGVVIIGFTGVVIVINPAELKFGYYFIFPLLAIFLSIEI